MNLVYFNFRFHTSVRSCSICLSDLFCLAWCFQGPYMLLQMVGFPHFLWLNMFTFLKNYQTFLQRLAVCHLSSFAGSWVWIWHPHFGLPNLMMRPPLCVPGPPNSLLFLFLQDTPLLYDVTQPTHSLHTPLLTSTTSDIPYNTGWSVLPKEIAINMEKALGGGNLLEVVSVVRGTLKTASNAPVCIAVTGDSSNGMSSFINALRGIGHEEEDSARTGVVRTTQIPTRYFSPHFPNVVLWDLPGTRAAIQSLENYMEEMKFSQYDLFIIIASEQFSKNLVKLAKIIQGSYRSS